MSDEEGKIVDLLAKRRDKAKKQESKSMAVRRLVRAVREMQEGGSTPQEIARLLRLAADNLNGKNPA